MFSLKGDTADELFSEACWKFKHRAQIEETRNGKVLAMQEPALIELSDPMHRILYNNERDANPFFHLMESIWMWAGRNDVEWIQQFNKGIAQYADDGILHGAYGNRWQHHFGVSQLNYLVKQIEADPTSRQHVLQMWDHYDLTVDKRDKPCNISICFRVSNGYLDMTVFNRSNDLVWGALGANIVHMTMLHELMASASNQRLGVYRVISNNLHLYEQHWDLMDGAINADIWKHTKRPTPLALSPAKIDLEAWLTDAESFCHGYTEFTHHWFRDVAKPMEQAYLNKAKRASLINEIKCPAWRGAADLWQERRQTKT